jgi:lysyl-tRNA synthetase class 2
MNRPQESRSSVICDFDYDGNRSKLYVAFVNGKTYVYDGVPQATFDALAAASSKGEFFDARIRNRYPSALAASWPSGLRH